MGKLEINPKLQNVLTKLREAEVEFKEALCELEKREGVPSTGEMEDFIEGMSYCLSSVAGAIGSDARQSIRELYLKNNNTMKKLEVNPRLADVLINLRKSAVEFEKIVNEIEKKRLVSHSSKIEKFVSSMGECTEAVCSVIGSEIEQNLYDLIPEKE